MHVTAAYRPWRGEEEVAPEDADILIVTHFLIDGHWIWADHVRLHNDGPFLYVSILRMLPDEDSSDLGRKEHAAILASQEEGAWIDQDYDWFKNDDWITYPVTTLESVMIPFEAPALVVS